MRGTEMLAKPRAGRKKGLTYAALPALAFIWLLAGPLLLHAEETAPAVQPLEEAIRAGGSKPARFVLVGGKTAIGRIVRIDQDALVIRRPSAGLLSLPFVDIVKVKIKAADGALILGQITRMPDGGIGWHADGDLASSAEIAGVEADARHDKGGPLIRLDKVIEDEEVDAETVDVKLTKLKAPGTTPQSSRAPSVRLMVTADETSENDKLMYFRLTLSEPATRSIVIIYTMINGTAVAPGDYTHRQGVVVFEPGQTKAAVATSITNDTATEGPESFTFFVTGDPAAVAIEQRKITATIADDDS
ncbi:MAG: Calx-beta domain-containing protein [Geminicoccaceae bacterium]